MRFFQSIDFINKYLTNINATLPTIIVSQSFIDLNHLKSIMPTIPITVKTMSGPTLSFEVNSEDKVGTLKLQIEKKVNIPPQQQKLLFNGRPVNEEASFEAQGIKAGSILHFVIVLIG